MMLRNDHHMNNGGEAVQALKAVLTLHNSGKTEVCSDPSSCGNRHLCGTIDAVAAIVAPFVWFGHAENGAWHCQAQHWDGAMPCSLSCL